MPIDEKGVITYTEKLPKWSAYKLAGVPCVRILWGVYTMQVSQYPWGSYTYSVGCDYPCPVIKGNINHKTVVEGDGTDELDCLSKCIAKVRELEDAKK